MAHGGITMKFTIIDQHLICLVDQQNVPMAMSAAGYSQDQISGAWREARRAGCTESTGLGMDRLSAGCLVWAGEVRSAKTD